MDTNWQTATAGLRCTLETQGKPWATRPPGVSLLRLQLSDPGGGMGEDQELSGLRRYLRLKAINLVMQL